MSSVQTTRRALAVMIAALSLCACVVAQSAAPRFEDYPARRYAGRNAPARITGDARAFRSRLRWAVKNQRANFAGDQILTGWGCGTSCYQFALISAKTGRVTFSGFSVQWSSGVTEPLEFRPDSRLLIVRGMRNEDGDEGEFYYLWKGQRLKLLRSDRRDL